MKSMAFALTVLALAAPFAANASDGSGSKQCVGKMNIAAKAAVNSVAKCRCDQASDPDPDPYVVHG